MHLQDHHSLQSGRPHRAARTVIMLAATLLLATSAGFTSAEAADSSKPLPAGPSAMRQSASQSLRLGLQKSAIIHLPVGAKDVIVGNTDLVDVVLKNRDTAYLFARQTGQTNVFFLGSNGQQILQLDLEVTLDTKALKALLDRSLPGSQIQVDSTGSNVVLRGSVKDAQQGKTAEDLAKRFMASNGGGDTSVVNLLTIAEGNQVLLKVRMVEMKRSVLKQLGVNLSGSIQYGTFKFDFNNKTDAEVAHRTLEGQAIFPNLEADIRALENNGVAKVLAEPTLTAVSGAPASFHAGGEYPYNTCDQSNVAFLQCSVEFKKYGVTLDFTPTVLAEDRIALNVYTEVSDIAPNVYEKNIPVLDTRNAQTSVELPSGGSMYLAGLIKNTSRQDMENTPGLRSLPVVGALFSAQKTASDETELVVIVTPYVVGPTGESKLATPLDNFNSATDLQQLFLGRLNKVYGPPGASADPGVYNGKVGHIIE